MRSTPARPEAGLTVPPEICPNCGSEVPPQARACPECGADEKTGWSDAAHSERLGLPDEEFDHDDFVRREFTKIRPSPIPKGIFWFWWLVALGLVIGFLVMLLG